MVPAPANSATGRGQRAGFGAVIEVVVTIGAALLLAWIVQALLFKPYRIPSGSMENTLRCGERVIVNRLSYRFHDPKRGDVVVFHPPAQVDAQGNANRSTVSSTGGSGAGHLPSSELEPAKVNYVKRIVGLPGDTVKVTGQRAVVDGKQLSEPYLHPLPAGGAGVGADSNYGPIKVPKGEYFMMGDNRTDSSDSRVFGTVPQSYIVGRVFMAYWPPSHLGKLPSKDSGSQATRADDPNCEESTGATSGGSDA